MTAFLVRLFVRNADDVDNAAVRESYGKLAGAVGIASNLLLVIGKLFAGWASSSLAMMADAVNNLSDCASSVITLAGFRLAALPPDEKHPYGHARFEYISGLVVSFLVLTIGFEFLKSSVEKILHPEPIAFHGLIAAILVASIAVKLWQGLFNRSIGKRIRSDALRATAADSLNDAISTAVVLAGAVLSHETGLMLDGWLSLAVAIFVLVSGIRLVIDTLNPLLGTAPEDALVKQIQEKVMSYPSVLGLHDLIVHNYGPGRVFASVHVEVPADQHILVSHDIADNMERDFQLDMNIELVVHLDPIVTNDAELDTMRRQVGEVVRRMDPVLTIHDFRMVQGASHTNLIFDIVVPPRFALSDDELRAELLQRIRKLVGCNIYCIVTVDHSYTTHRPTQELP